MSKMPPGYYWVKLYHDTDWTIGEVDEAATVEDEEQTLYVIGDDTRLLLSEAYQVGRKIEEPEDKS